MLHLPRLFMFHLVTEARPFTMVLVFFSVSQDCNFPNYIKGDYFCMIDGASVDVIVGNTKWDDLTCKGVYNHPKPVEGTTGANHTYLLYSET